MFDINGKEYELKYNMKRIEMIENASGTPMMSEMQKNKGMLGLTTLKLYVAYGLKENGMDTLVDVKTGIKMAEALIENEGYIAVNGAVIEAIERDCPFFFQNA